MRLLLFLSALCGLAILALPSLSPQASTAATFSGVPQIVDGDGLRIDGRNLRLHGIDAPEVGQICEGGPGAPVAGPFDCGAWARDALAARIAGAQVACVQRDFDARYGRPVVQCDLAGADLNEALVAGGYALAYRRYSRDYVAAEDAARAARAGLWATTMQTPEAFRRDGPAIAPERTASGCDIKGNISAGGLIYHMPGQEHYGRTRVDEARGERWFCSPREAEAAGWRAARR